MHDDQRKTMSPAEVAREYGVDARTVARWSREGKLQAAFLTPGGHRRYLRADIMKLVKPAEAP
jgi:excisionase family DNA binding protein